MCQLLNLIQTWSSDVSVSQLSAAVVVISSGSQRTMLVLSMFALKSAFIRSRGCH